MLTILLILAAIAILFAAMTLPALIRLLEKEGVAARSPVPFYRLYKIYELVWEKGSFYVFVVSLVLVVICTTVLNNDTFNTLSTLSSLGKYDTVKCLTELSKLPNAAAATEAKDVDGMIKATGDYLNEINATKSKRQLQRNEPFNTMESVKSLPQLKDNIRAAKQLASTQYFWTLTLDGAFDTPDYFDDIGSAIPAAKVVLTVLNYVCIGTFLYSACLLPFYVAGKYGCKPKYGWGLLLLPFVFYYKLLKSDASYRRDRDVNVSIFPYLNGAFFILFCLFIIIPIWKVLVDSLDLTSGYGMRLIPETFGLAGYESVFSNPTLLRPFMISVFTTVCGTFLGLLLSTLGAYVLIQWDMPGRGFFAFMLLFTMIFQGGMIPTYIVMNNYLHITNTLWVVILMPAINVYNLVLMRNFFEGIPTSLFESATLDGCTPMQIFYKIVLPLSKAALASIGLMFAVSYWNDYTNYKLYITREQSLFNFQMKLRSVIMGSDLPSANGGATENTVTNAAIIVAILPFMVLYPFLQKYFVKGINIGAVKE